MFSKQGDGSCDSEKRPDIAECSSDASSTRYCRQCFGDVTLFILNLCCKSFHTTFANITGLSFFTRGSL